MIWTGFSCEVIRISIAFIVNSKNSVLIKFTIVQRTSHTFEGAHPMQNYNWLFDPIFPVLFLAFNISIPILFIVSTQLLLFSQQKNWKKNIKEIRIALKNKREREKLEQIYNDVNNNIEEKK